MHIENAKINDWQTLYQIAKETTTLDVHTPYTYYLMCMMFANQIFLLKKDDEVIGYILSISNPHYVFIWQIAIKPKYQDKGYSKYLYEAVYNYTKKNGYSIILLSIDPTNVSSVAAMHSFCVANQLFYSKYLDEIKIDIPGYYECEDIYMISV